MNAVYENKSAPLAVGVDKYLSYVPHLHKEVELVYVMEGSAVAYADRGRFPMRAGDLFLAFPNQIHYYESAPGAYEVIIALPDVFFGMESEIRNHVPDSNVVHIGQGSPGDEFLRQAAAAQGRYRLTAQYGYLNLLMSGVFPQLTLKPLIFSDNSTVHSILDYCSRSFAGDITLETAAQSLHLSKYYISHVMNLKLHLSFCDYVNTLRVDAACDLLKETNKKIADISEDVGFGTIRSFNRAFRHFMSITPREYRETLRADQSRDFR